MLEETMINQKHRLEMKINRILVALILPLLFASNRSAAYTLVDVTNAGNWNWSSTVPNQPWPNGTLPTTNSFVEVEANVVITNDMTNAACMVLDSSFNGVNGTVVMAPGSTLLVGGALQGYGTEQLGSLIATATNCTVIYQGNAYWAKRTDYWNLVLSGWGNFFTGPIPVNASPPPITIHGNFSLTGTNVASNQTNLFTGVNVQLGTNMTIFGNLYIGVSNFFDPSICNLTVKGQTTCAGTLWDGAGGVGSNYFAGGLTILPDNMVLTNPTIYLVIQGLISNVDYLGPNGLPLPGGQTNVYGGAFYVGDATEWNIGGNFTNNGITGFGKNSGSVDFSGTGVIAGSNAFIIPTMIIDGTNEIADTITLTTNYPVVNGTIVFDLANTNQIILNAGTNWFWYSTNGTLDVINSGLPPLAGNSYQLFNNIGNTNYGGQYVSTTLPSLAGGLSWTNELLINGSIAVVGVAAPPIITSFHYNPATLQFTLTWASSAGANYTVLESPSLNPAVWSPLQMNIPSGGSTTTATVTMPAGAKGFLRVMMQ